MTPPKHPIKKLSVKEPDEDSVEDACSLFRRGINSLLERRKASLTDIIDALCLTLADYAMGIACEDVSPETTKEFLCGQISECVDILVEAKEKAEAGSKVGETVEKILGMN